MVEHQFVVLTTKVRFLSVAPGEVAQRSERQLVTLEVAGSKPVFLVQLSYI